MVILYIREYLHVHVFTGTRVSEDFQFRVSGSRNNRKRTALIGEQLTLLLIDHLKPFKISTLKNAHWFGTHMVIPFEQRWEQAELPFKPIQMVLRVHWFTT